MPYGFLISNGLFLHRVTMASGPPTYGNVATMVKNKGIRNNIPRWTPSVSPPPRKTALHMAAARNDIEELVSMIGTKLSLGDTKFVPEENTNTCTIEAENTIDVNTIGPFRQTALHVATLKGRIQVPYPMCSCAMSSFYAESWVVTLVEHQDCISLWSPVAWSISMLVRLVSVPAGD